MTNIEHVHLFMKQYNDKLENYCTELYEVCYVENNEFTYKYFTHVVVNDMEEHLMNQSTNTKHVLTTTLDKVKFIRKFGEKTIFL